MSQLTQYKLCELTCRTQLASTFVDLEAVVDVEEDEYDPDKENLSKLIVASFNDTHALYR